MPALHKIVIHECKQIIPLVMFRLRSQARVVVAIVNNKRSKCGNAHAVKCLLWNNFQKCFCEWVCFFCVICYGYIHADCHWSIFMLFLFYDPYESHLRKQVEILKEMPLSNVFFSDVFWGPFSVYIKLFKSYALVSRTFIHLKILCPKIKKR